MAKIGPITRRIATAEMIRLFSLNEEEQGRLIPSGRSTYIANRTGWAMTFLTKGKLIERVAARTYRATERGSGFLETHPDRIAVEHLEAVEGWQEAWVSARKSDGPGASSPPASTATPLELIDEAVETLHQATQARLMEAILKQSPAFFEKLVLDLLIKMGYGGSRESASEHVGRSGDEGIDGRINQDMLGLDQILVQAKRYAPDQSIDRKTIQAFIGSLAGHGVSKGIFITTSRFAESAKEFVQRGAQTKIVLIDGAQLLRLMMEHRVGVRVERSVEVLDIDHNYFEAEE